MPNRIADRSLAIGGRIFRACVYLTLIAPAAIVVATSFTAGDVLRFPPQGFSLRWYVEAYGNPTFRASLLLSLELAMVATVASMTIGFCAAYALDRYRFRGQDAYRNLLLSPLVVPAVVKGLALLQFMTWIGINQSFWALMIGHILVTLPYVVRTLSAGMILFDRTLEQAAMTLRARPMRVLRTVTLPLLLPSILTATIFAFVTSFGNVTLSVFLGFGQYVTLPVQIFTYVEHNYDPMIAAVSSVIIFVTIGVILAAEKITKKATTL